MTLRMPSLTIGTRTSRLPIVQGGMAVRISLAPLAVAVAEAGGVGIIALSGMEPDEAKVEVRQARAATNGVLGVNVMVAVRNFKELVQAAIDEGIDLVIAGAGFSRDVFSWCQSSGVEMVPVVGSERVAQLSQRFGASAVIVEGVDAGGHLGTEEPMLDLLPRIIEAVDIPVIGAGNVVTGADIKRVLDLGAAGVQMGTRFGVTVESSASDAMKKLWVESDCTVLVESPVGYPGRAVINELWCDLKEGIYPEKPACRSCLKECSKKYCIIDRLEAAQQGDAIGGLVFAGESVSRVHDIPTVSELTRRLENEWVQAEESA